MANNIGAQIAIMLLFMREKVLCRVDWKVGQNIIVIGKPLILKCEITGSNNNVSRQWTGAENNRLISFNGITTDPVKYQEIKESSSKYALKIAETSESDLDYPYSCRFGFQFSEKMLAVSPQNLIALPDDNSTKAAYLHQGDNYTLDIDFNLVYPMPECQLNTKGKVMKLNITRSGKYRILYYVSLHLESSEPLHECGKPAHVTCKLGNTTYSHNIPHEFDCNDIRILLQTEHTETGIITLCICTAITVLVLPLVAMGVICILRRKARYRKDMEQNRKTNTSGKDYLKVKITSD